MVPKHCTPKHLTPIEVCRLSVKAYEELPEQFWIIDQRPITGGNLEELSLTCTIDHAGDGIPQELIDFCARHKLVISGTDVFIDRPDVTYLIGGKYR